MALCLFDHFLHVLFPRGSRVYLFEHGSCGICDDLGERRFSGSRRPVKNDGGKLVRFYRPVEELVLSDDVLLPHHLVQSPRAEPCRERSLGFFILLGHILKKIKIAHIVLPYTTDDLVYILHALSFAESSDAIDYLNCYIWI